MKLRLVLPTLLLPFALVLGGCPSASNAPAPLNKTAVASQLGAGVAFDTGAVLVNTCVIKKDTDAGRTLDAAFNGVAASFDSANNAIQAGITDPTVVGLSTAIAALQQAQAILAAPKATPAQAKSMRASIPKSAVAKSASFNDIAALVQTFLPIVLSAAPELIDLVRGFINNINAPTEDVSVAAVAAANAQMHVSLGHWASAECTQ